MAYRNQTVSSKKSVVTQPSTRPLPLSSRGTINGSLDSAGFTPPVNNINAPQANSEKIVLNRDVFNKIAFNNTVNTNFTQLDQVPPDLSFFDPNLATVEDFFNLYQNLFFQIPKNGDINSHQYLVIESTAYTGYIENQEQIDALLEEITDLREENLQLQLDMAQLLGAKESIDQLIRQNPDVEGGSLDELLNAEAELGALEGNSSSDRPVNNPGVGEPPGIGSPGGGSGGGGGNSGGIIDALGEPIGFNSGEQIQGPTPNVLQQNIY